MTNQEILTKAIQLAIAGGWEAAGLNTPYARKNYTVKDIVDHFTDEATEYSTNDIIFNHDFAKALWGESRNLTPEESTDYRGQWQTLDWQYHLQQMVLADDPIVYLGKHL